MSEPMQAPVARPPRAERTTTSCSECRRRKQKCNQGQPCSNCARRFPPPVCEYKSSSRRPGAVAVSQDPAFTVSLFSPSLTGDGLFDPQPFRHPVLPQIQSLLPLPSWDYQRNSQDGCPRLTPPAFGLLNHMPPPPIPPGEYAWSTEPSRLSTFVSSCEDGCTAHSNKVHDALRILRAFHSATRHWTGGGGSWSFGQANPWAMAQGVPAGGSGSSSSGDGGIPWPVANQAQEFSHLPVPQTMQNTDMMAIYIDLISQFKASLDGNPDASNPYIKLYVPYCVNSPLLSHVALYTAACFLTDTGHIPRTVAIAQKDYVFKLLSAHIHSQLSASDEVIAGVVQFIVDEWHWGNADHLRRHLRGLRDMIMCRGGFRTLGLHGLIAKLAITTDVAIALSFETPPFLQGGSEFDFRDNTQMPLRLPLNTPLISTLASFSSCADALRIHPAVAVILDDMRFLLATVLALPENPSAKELQKVYTTASWIHERISRLPADSPAARRPSSPGTGTTLRQRESRGVPEMSAGESPNPTSRSRSRSRPQEQQQQQQQPPRRSPAQTLSPGTAYPPGREASRSPADQHRPRSRPSPTPPAPTTTIPEPSQQQQQPPQPPPPPPDYVYQTVRLSALLYCRAIMRRQPFSALTTPHEFLALWTTAWKVPLATWRALLGVFNWVLLPIVSVSAGNASTSTSDSGGGGSSPHGRFVKGMLNISLLQIGMENWDIAYRAMDAAVRLQRWLAGGGAYYGVGHGGQGRMERMEGGEGSEEEGREDGQRGRQGGLGGGGGGGGEGGVVGWDEKGKEKWRGL